MLKVYFANQFTALLENETVVTVSIPIDDETFCAYDIRITDDEGNAVEFTGVDFCELEVLTVLMNSNSDLYYTLE